MEYLTIALLIVCGVLAAASWIVSKSPNAKQAIDKLVPFQGFLGVALLAIGVINLIRWLDVLKHAFKGGVLFGLAMWGSLVTAIILGFLLGMPQIAKWIPGDSPAEQKALDMQKKLGVYSTLFGVLGIAFGILFLLYRLEILKPSLG